VTTIAIAANRGDVGGGEVMLVNLATALRDLGHEVSVVAPREPDGVVRLAESHALPVTTIEGTGRAAYARALRRWHRAQAQDLLLWCNGLLPAAATALRSGRVVHLHQPPDGFVQRVLGTLARWRSVAVVVPSAHMRTRLGSRTTVLPNWTQGDLAPREPSDAGIDPSSPVRIGYLGRVGRAKGVDVLGEACGLLEPGLRDRVELVVVGDDRFMPASDREAVDRALAGSGVTVSRLGWQARETFFETTDLAVFPSVWEEPFGLVVAEAMEARCPVVVSDAGALPEVVGGSYPWSARSGDAKSLADVITRAVAALPATELTRSMRARWEEHFSPSAGRRRLAALLDSWDQL
jgi:glycosyltransferase involved in cell wall biosynthesis